MPVFGLSEKLQKLRKARKLTQQDVSDQTGIARTSIQGYENSSTSPSIEVLLQLSSFYNVSCDYLLGISKKKELSLTEFTDSQEEVILHSIDNLIESFKDIIKKETKK